MFSRAMLPVVRRMFTGGETLPLPPVAVPVG